LTNSYWPMDKKKSIRDLFVERMGSFLPNERTHPKLYALIHLPNLLGGYGLGFPEELRENILKSPAPIHWVVNRMLSGEFQKSDLRIFRSLNSNTSARGVEEILRLKEVIIDQLDDYPDMVGGINIHALRQKFPGFNDRHVLSLADRAGFLSFEEFASRAIRGNLFQDLLMGVKKPKVFNTKPIVATFSNIWGNVEKRGWDIHDSDLYSVVPESELKRVMNKNERLWFFDTNQETMMDIGPWCEVGDPDEEFDFVECLYKDIYTKGFPNLRIGKGFLGIKKC